MKYRPFGNMGFQSSEIGLGTWQFGGDWGEIDEQHAYDILSEALDGGVNFFDTADVYGLGISESILGSFFREQTSKPFIATKLGRFPEPGWPGNFTYQAMEVFTAASMRRLETEALDLTQLHCIPTEELRKGDVFEHLRRLKSRGMIKAFGASVETVEEGFVCLEQDGIASLQVIFNIFRQKPAEKLFEEARQKGVAIIARVPLASGLLTGKFTKRSVFHDQDHRTYNKDGQAFNVGETFAGLPFERGVELADQLKTLLLPDIDMGLQALRWILDHDAVSTVIPGASSPNQAYDNIAASKLAPLPQVIHKQIAEFYRTEVAAYVRGPY